MSDHESKDTLGRILATLQTLRFRIGVAVLVLLIGAMFADYLTVGLLLAVILALFCVPPIIASLRGSRP